MFLVVLVDIMDVLPALACTCTDAFTTHHRRLKEFIYDKIYGHLMYIC